MECSEVRRHLSAYFDGELPPEMAQAIESALVGCPECQQELEELSILSELARDGFEAPANEVDFSNFPDQVMARIRTEEAIGSVEGVKVERETQSSQNLFETITAFLGELLRFERPLAGAAAAALVVLVVVGLQGSEVEEQAVSDTKNPTVAQQKQVTANDIQPAVAKKSPATPSSSEPSDKSATQVAVKKTNRRQRAMEESAGSRDMAAIESSRAPEGVRINIEQDKGRPAIVWHVDEETEDVPN